MKDRREIRRSSPDAPQGVVPVLTVFAGLVAVVVVAGLAFVGSGSGSTETPSDERAVERDPVGENGPTTVVPTTVLIRGSTSTALFVTTTTPITTTTTTTTTTLPGPALETDGAEVVFGPGQTSVTFTIRSADPDGIAFELRGIPRGFQADPMRGTVAADAPVQVTLRMTDVDGAREGIIVVVGDDGSRASIRVRIETPSVSVTSVRVEPSQPLCEETSRLVAVVGGRDIASVTARVDLDGARSAVSMSGSGAGSWTGTLPGGPEGARLAGTVTVKDRDGGTASEDFAARIIAGPACQD